MLPLQLLTTKLIEGDHTPMNPSATFAHTLYAHIHDSEGTTLFMSGTNHDNKPLLHAVTHSTSKCMSLLTPKVTLNAISNQDNPLLNQHIQTLGLLESIIYGVPDLHLMCITKHEPSILYIFDSINPLNFAISRSNPLLDSNSTVGHICSCTGLHNNMLVAAIKPADAPCFGAPGSGIISFLFGRMEGSEPGANLIRLLPPEAQGSHRATALDQTHPAFCYGTNITIRGTPLIYSTQQPNTTFYIAVNIKTGDAPDNIGCAVVKGCIANQYVLTFTPVLPQSALVPEQDAIIGIAGADRTIAIKNIGIANTSTSLQYLIIARDDNQVYALPLTSGNEKPEQNGIIASKNCRPIAVYDKQTHVSLGRAIKDAVTSPTDVPQATDPAVLVGGGNATLPTNTYVTDMQVIGDAIVIATNNGLWISRALFNHEGSIIDWTNWQRYANITTATDSVIINPTNCTITTLHTHNLDTQEPYTSIQRTEWTKISKASDEIRALDSAKILYSSRSHALPTPPVLAGISDDYVIISSCRHDGNQPNKQYTYPCIPNGAKDSCNTDDIIYIERAQFAHIEPITTITAGQTGPDNIPTWFIGGNNGFYALQHTKKNTLADKQEASLYDTVAGTVPVYYKHTNHLVKKLVYDDGYLYILTDTTLERIDLQKPSAEPTTIATVATIWPKNPQQKIFNDLIVSDTLALLATNDGLLINSNGNTIQKDHQVSWQPVALHGHHAYAITQLIPVTKTGVENDFAKYPVSNIYLLIGGEGNGPSYLSRCAVYAPRNGEITPDCVQPFEDPSLHNRTSHFAQLAPNCYQYTSDGISNLHISQTTDNQKLICKNLCPYTEPAMFPKKRTPIINNIQHNITEPPQCIQHPYGSWIISDESGSYINA